MTTEEETVPGPEPVQESPRRTWREAEAGQEEVRSRAEPPKSLRGL